MSKSKTKRIVEVINKVTNPAVRTEWAVEDDIEMWIKMKVNTWDKDANGKFTVEEVQAAMADLQDTEHRLAGMKMRFIGVFGFILLFTMVVCGAVAVILAVTKNTEVPESGELRTSNPDSKKPKQTELVVTTQSRGTIDWNNMLDFDTTTDQWLISDIALRDLDKVAFWHQNQSYYNFEVAEVIRTDSGPGGTNDKLEITTTGGVKMRIWESIGQLEVLWPNSNMWEGAPQPGSGGRLLSEGGEELPDSVEAEHLLSADIEDPSEDGTFKKAHSSDRRLGKGGTFIYVGGGAGYAGRGGYSNQCNGWCSVPYGTADGCMNWCGQGQCYTSGLSTYQCNGTSSRTAIGWLLQTILAVMFIGRML